MAANTVHIALPDPLKAFVEERVAEGEFATPSDYIRSLIREDRERRRERIEALLLEALDSKPIEIMPDQWESRTFTAALREKLA
jgi:antitoxin ParD1/3/4